MIFLLSKYLFHIFVIFLKNLILNKTLFLFTIYVCFTALIFYLHKNKSEILIFLFGFFFGILHFNIEKLNYLAWGTSTNLIGIPVWIPFMWGHVLIAAKRIMDFIEK